ncbi:hypothetical protein QBC42DRAFT_298198 [Cladorrhinum samala]|uniref:Cytochrome b5 heme-binding domain-containing protein n=1 Tax=Cladorrhinum samala TaxID=585594 RepID=A0AAV9HJF1_9PEZI|nr:hypothetical protein QBC42DRAFT_298198 [Cladorrhinum samala]
MAAAAPPPPRRNSPWLEKYGGRSDSILNVPNRRDNHSGVAPALPFVSPAAAVRNRASYPFQTRPSDEDLDKVFASERQQTEWNCGLTTWEAVILNKYLLGGKRDDEILNKEQLREWGLVVVDEPVWNPVFSKAKWYNLNARILDERSGYFKTKTIDELKQKIPADSIWSVDQTLVWDELRVALELANRWLGHMAVGPWLNNLVQRLPIPWLGAEGDHHYSTADGGREAPQRIPTGHPHVDPHRTLAFIANVVAPLVIWRFVDEDHYEHRPKDAGFQHYGGRTSIKQTNFGTVEQPHARTRICIDIHVQYLRVLINPSTTLAERCLTTVKLAATILQQVMHAIYKARYLENHRLKPPGVIVFSEKEPFYGYEWTAGLGKSAMKSLFGGELQASPDPNTRIAPGFMYLLGKTDWPDPRSKNPQVVGVYARGDMPFGVNPAVDLIFELAGHRSQQSPLLGAWISSLMREDFYTEVANKVGLKAFNIPNILEAESISRGYHNRVYPARSLNEAGFTALIKTSHPEVPELVNKTIEELARRNEQWKKIARWRGSILSIRWQLSPYSNPAGRAVLNLFTETYARIKPLYEAQGRTTRVTEAKARLALELERVYQELADAIRDVWHNQAQLSFAKYPQGTWVYLVLGALMGAVLPVRDQDWQGELRGNVLENVWTPNSAAQAEQNALPGNSPLRWRFPELYTQFEEPPGINHGHIRLSQRTRQTRVSYLWFARALLNEYEALGCPLQPELWQALRDEVESFTLQLFSGGARRKRDGDCLDFDFVLPEYRDSSRARALVPGGDLIPFTPDPAAAGALARFFDADQAPVFALAARVIPEIKESKNIAAQTGAKTYYTVSQVGDQQNWSLLPYQDGTYEVYDFATAWPAEERLRGQPFERRAGISTAIIKSGKVRRRIQRLAVAPLGELMVPRLACEVAERDGRDGRDLWCQIGNWVYDLTDVSSLTLSDQQRMKVLDVSNGIVPLETALAIDPEFPGIIRSLAPYRMGFIHDRPSQRVRRQREFTLTSLSRHVFREMGMYCAIDNNVYDLSPYLHSHPGGAEILRQSAGKDVTTEFRAAHVWDNWQTLLSRYDEQLKVGTLVAETAEHGEYTIATLPVITAVRLAQYNRTDGYYPRSALLAVHPPPARLDRTQIVYDVTPVFAFGTKEEKDWLGPRLGTILPAGALGPGRWGDPEFQTHIWGWAVAKIGTAEEAAGRVGSPISDVAKGEPGEDDLDTSKDRVVRTLPESTTAQTTTIVTQPITTSEAVTTSQAVTSPQPISTSQVVTTSQAVTVTQPVTSQSVSSGPETYLPEAQRGTSFSLRDIMQYDRFRFSLSRPPTKQRDIKVQLTEVSGPTVPQVTVEHSTTASTWSSMLNRLNFDRGTQRAKHVLSSGSEIVGSSLLEALGLRRGQPAGASALEVKKEQDDVIEEEQVGEDGEVVEEEEVKEEEKVEEQEIEDEEEDEEEEDEDEEEEYMEEGEKEEEEEEEMDEYEDMHVDEEIQIEKSQQEMIDEEIEEEGEEDDRDEEDDGEEEEEGEGEKVTQKDKEDGRGIQNGKPTQDLPLDQTIREGQPIRFKDQRIRDGQEIRFNEGQTNPPDNEINVSTVEDAGTHNQTDAKSAMVRPGGSRRKRNVEVENAEDEAVSRESSARKKKSRYE